jgi:hypothetical protein
MAGDRSRYCLLVSAFGALLLAVSVFLPWYGVSFTASGVVLVQQAGEHLAAQFGNASLQGYVHGLHADLGSLAGQEFTALSAHEALRNLNIVLLVLAGLALLDALVPLAGHATGLPDGAGKSVAVLGAVATACVLYRVLVPPTLAGGLLSLSVREGAWLALLGSLTMVGAGLWPRLSRIGEASGSTAQGAWAGLSGWTPEA